MTISLEEAEGVANQSGDVELWRPVAGHEGRYQISSLGRVRSLMSAKNEGILKQPVDRYGYRYVNLYSDGRAKHAKVHRLVCIAFNGQPPVNTECGHLDGDKSNNAALNLKWVTRLENTEHQFLHGVRVRGKPVVYNGRNFGPNPTRSKATGRKVKLSDEQVIEIRQKSARGISAYALAKEYSVCKRTAQRLIKGMQRDMSLSAHPHSEDT